MKEWLTFVTENAIILIDILALIFVLIGTVEAFFGGLRVMLSSRQGHEQRDVWLRYGRWLVAALTFQLAADIIETSIVPTWDDIGRLAAIAVVRTFLNFFLERDVGDAEGRKNETAKSPAPSVA